jgi:hypothetical protein
MAAPWSHPPWLLPAWRPLMRVNDWWENRWSEFVNRVEKPVRIAIVGDLSSQDRCVPLPQVTLP